MIEKPHLMDTFNLDNLTFRRQFILTKDNVPQRVNWVTINMRHNFVLSVHPDLEYSVYTQDDQMICILGLVYSVVNPKWSGETIVNYLGNCSKNIYEIIRNSKELGGRWVIIFQDDNETYLFNDPCGLRSIYYKQSVDETICASQPTLINFHFPDTYRKDKDLLQFLGSTRRYKNESAWIGNKSVFSSCFRLLPNHFLRCSDGKVVRYFSISEITKQDNVKDLVTEIVTILHNSFSFLVENYELKQALTSGYDSRLLLAASRPNKERISYFVDRMGIYDITHPDVWIPKIMSSSLDINFKVINSKHKLPDWFLLIYTNSVALSRTLPKNRSIYTRLENAENSVLINGNGSGIFKHVYDKKASKYSELSSDVLAAIVNYENEGFVINELQQWIIDVDESDIDKSSLLSLLYWEQRMGNWGAQYPAESDIANEEISPFNNRLLIELFLSATDSYLLPPKYPLFRMIINDLWPECLDYPFNPVIGGKQLISKVFRIPLKLKRLLVRK